MPMTDDDKQRVDRLRAEVTAAENEAAEAKKAAEAKVAEIKNKGESPFSAKNYPTIDALFQKAEIPTNRAERKKNELMNFLHGYMHDDNGAARGGVRSFVPTIGEYKNAMGEGTDSLGGYVVPTEQAKFYVDRLRPKSVVLAALPADRLFIHGTDQFKVPKIGGSSTAAFVAEHGAIAPSDLTLAESLFTPRKLAALVIASNELLADSNPAARSVIEYDLIQTSATALDAALLEGSGTPPVPRGIRNFTGATDYLPGGVDGSTPTYDQAADALTAIEGVGVDTDIDGTSNLVWFMAPRSWATFRKVKDTTGRYLAQPDPTSPTRKSIFGIPVYVSSQISVAETVGTSNDASWVGLVDMRQLAVARRAEVSLFFDPYGLANTDDVRIRVTSRFDVQPLNAAATLVWRGVRP